MQEYKYKSIQSLFIALACKAHKQKWTYALLWNSFPCWISLCQKRGNVAKKAGVEWKIDDFWFFLRFLAGNWLEKTPAKSFFVNFGEMLQKRPAWLVSLVNWINFWVCCYFWSFISDSSWEIVCWILLNEVWENFAEKKQLGLSC